MKHTLCVLTYFLTFLSISTSQDEPIINLSPLSLDFQIVQNEDIEETQYITIGNSGNSDLEVEILSTYEDLVQIQWRQDNYSGINFQNLVSTQYVDIVNANFGFGAPPGCPTDYFSVKYTGQVYCENSATYYFSANCCDDDQDIHIDGEFAFNLTSNFDEDHIFLEEGFHTIEVYFVEWGGSACVTLNWSLSPGDYQPVTCSEFQSFEYEWLSLEPTQLNISPGIIEPVSVSANASGLDLGFYEAVLRVNSNAPLNPLLEIPVSLSVVENGCTYPEALNYNPTATLDNGTCEFLFGDLNSDGFINILDVVLLVDDILQGGY